MKMYTVDLSPRPNVHCAHSLARDVLDVVLGASLGFVLYVLACVVMAS